MHYPAQRTLVFQQDRSRPVRRSDQAPHYSRSSNTAVTGLVARFTKGSVVWLPNYPPTLDAQRMELMLLEHRATTPLSPKLYPDSRICQLFASSPEIPLAAVMDQSAWSKDRKGPCLCHCDQLSTDHTSHKTPRSPNRRPSLSGLPRTTSLFNVNPT